MADTLSKSGEPCDCTNQVEWQVAYFWLICLALNSMTQPSGRVSEFSQKYRFILRSSPIICGMDGLAVLALWIAHMFWHLEGPRNAANRIARARFRDVQDKSEEGSLTSLEKNVPFRYAVFILGALPQAVKMFGSQGIPWIQAAGGSYLGSWVVMELLILLAAQTETTIPTNPTLTLGWKRLRKAWGVLAITLSSVFYALWNALQIPDQSLRWLGASYSAFGLFANLLVYWWAEDPLWLGLTLFGCFLIAEVVSLISLHVLDPLLLLVPVFLSVVPLLPALPSNGNFLSVRAWLGGSLGSTAFTRKWGRGVLQVLALLIQILVPLHYFMLHYDPRKSVKPKWTEWLG